MKKKLAGLLTALVLSPTSVNAQMIVSDPVNLAETVQMVALLTAHAGLLQAQLLAQEQTLAVEGKALVTQDQSLVVQGSMLEAQKKTLESLTGSSGIGGLLGDDAGHLEGNLPSDWSQVYSDAMNSTSSITSSAQSMLKEFQTQIDGMDREDAMRFVKQKLMEKGAYDRVMAQTAYNNEMAELKNIQELTNKIDSTTEMKEIADLQARIQTAQGAIQGEQAKLQLMSMLQISQDKILQEQKQYAQKRLILGADGEDLSIPDVTK